MITILHYPSACETAEAAPSDAVADAVTGTHVVTAVAKDGDHRCHHRRY